MSSSLSSSQILANAIPDNELGLNPEEISLLRQHQAAAAGSSSSRASRGSSQQQGLLMIESSSLAFLACHFDRVMQHIQQQLESLTEQLQTASIYCYDRAGNLIEDATVEIARFESINAQLNELELDFDKIQNIRDVVRDFRRRAQALEHDLEQSDSSLRTRSHGNRRHSSHRHGSEHSSSARHHRH